MSETIAARLRVHRHVLAGLVAKVLRSMPNPIEACNSMFDGTLATNSAFVGSCKELTSDVVQAMSDEHEELRELVLTALTGR